MFCLRRPVPEGFPPRRMRAGSLGGIEEERGWVVPHHEGCPVGVLPVDLHCILLTHRFLVVVDMLKPENLESSSVLQGLEYIDVPGSAKKDYKLTFLSYKEAVFNAMVSVDMGLWGLPRSC